MTAIQILDEETINHIAAGEVIERAASVVKELVENAVDAKAAKVTINIASDAKNITRISISDDGVGMTAEDAVLAFRQHATSKIRTQKDLETIETMGFRGEALASIATVAKVTLTTKPRGAQEAFQVIIHGGTVIKSGPAGAPEGTTIVVEDLFYNTPARKKFQHSVTTELSHIYDMTEKIALAHRSVSFVLQYQGKERFRTFGNGSFHDTIAAIFGTTHAGNLIEVSSTGGIAEVHGWITKPGCDMRSTANRFYLTINSRQITSRQLQWAVREGYGTLLPKGMYPAAYLDIVIDPHNVDVNVHPTKREVRLSRETEVKRQVQDAVYQALHTQEIFETTEKTPQETKPVDTAQTTLQQDAPVIQPQYQEPVTKASYSSPKKTEQQLRRTESGLKEAIQEMKQELPDILGQIAGTYILARSRDGELLIIDQHAAHERILYDQLLQKVKEKRAGQELIVPVTISLSRAEAAKMPELSETLRDAGYVIEPFGQETWAVRSVPVISSTLGDPGVIHEIISEAAGEAARNPERVLDRVIKTAACRAVIKGNTELSFAQMQRIVAQLMKTESPYTCPHGRPTVIKLEKEKLESMFLRT